MNRWFDTKNITWSRVWNGITHHLSHYVAPESALCSCGTANETAQHYFFDCNLFILLRNRLLASLRAVPITLDTLMYGHDLLTFETNLDPVLGQRNKIYVLKRV